MYEQSEDPGRLDEDQASIKPVLKFEFSKYFLNKRTKVSVFRITKMQTETKSELNIINI